MPFLRLHPSSSYISLSVSVTRSLSSPYCLISFPLCLYDYPSLPGTFLPPSCLPPLSPSFALALQRVRASRTGARLFVPAPLPASVALPPPPPPSPTLALVRSRPRARPPAQAPAAARPRTAAPSLTLGLLSHDRTNVTHGYAVAHHCAAAPTLGGRNMTAPPPPVCPGRRPRGTGR